MSYQAAPVFLFSVILKTNLLQLPSCPLSKNPDFPETIIALLDSYNVCPIGSLLWLR